MAALPKYTYKHITTGTTLVKNGTGTLAAVVVNKALSGTVTLQDGPNTIAILTNGTTAPLGNVLFGGAGGVQFGTQLQVVCSGTEDVTIIYE